MYSKLFAKSLRYLVPSIFTIILCIKLWNRSGNGWGDTSSFASSKEKENDSLHHESETITHKKLIDEVEHFEKKFFHHRDKPSRNCQKCDACRTIAYYLDKAFDLVESQMGIKTNKIDGFYYSEKGMHS